MNDALDILVSRDYNANIDDILIHATAYSLKLNLFMYSRNQDHIQVIEYKKAKDARVYM